MEKMNRYVLEQKEKIQILVQSVGIATKYKKDGLLGAKQLRDKTKVLMHAIDNISEAQAGGNTARQQQLIDNVRRILRDDMIVENYSNVCENIVSNIRIRKIKFY